MQYKTLYIEKFKANQSKVDTATTVIANHFFIASSAYGHIANKACVSKKLQQKIRTQATKFVKNADIQEEAKKQQAI